MMMTREGLTIPGTNSLNGTSSGPDFLLRIQRSEIFMQNLLGESNVQKGIIRQYVGDARLSWVHIEDIAAVAAPSLTGPEKHAGKTYRLGCSSTSSG